MRNRSVATLFSVSRASFLTLFIAIALLVPAILVGQGYFGTVSGVVSDASGAIIRGAKVTLLDEQKGYQFTTTSDNDGRYLFASIPPGSYSVSAEMKGFEKIVRPHLILNVSENATANLTLKVGAEAQSVEVKAQAQGIATEDAVTGQVVDRRFINDLPLIDRNVMDLTYLAPGVTDVDDQCPNCGGTNFVSNGSRGASADILMDGASITNFEPNGGVTQAVYTPSPEAVEEFKVQQSNFSAEYGFSGASVINMVTRSGTNSFHGSAYDFIRNTITDANNWFNDRAGVPIPPVHRHDFGVTIGGPIFKNKTFFFFDYEGLRASNMNTYTAGVPSAAERTGDFGEICADNGGTFNGSGICSVTAGQLWDPYSGTYNANDGGPVRSTPIPYNNLATYASPGSPVLNGTPYQLPVQPGNLIDPVAQKVLNLFPVANNPAQGIYNNWIASGATPNSNDQFDLKIDQRFSEKNLVSGRYSQEWNSTVPFNCFKTLIDPCGSGSNKGTAHVFSINDTYTLSPTLLLTTTFGITRGATLIYAYNSSLNSNPLSALGFPSYLKSNGFNGVPAMFINDYYAAGFPNAGNDPYGNYKQGQTTGQFSVLLSKIHGGHELKFGFEGRLHQQNYIQTNAPLGYFQFDNTGSSQCPFVDDFTDCGGDSMASFLMGQMKGSGASYYEIQFRPATENYQYATFAQDNWKVTPKVTLNLGLRYDVSLPRTDRYNRQNWFDPNVVSPLNNGSITYTDPITNQPTTLSLMGGEVFASSNERTNYVTDWHDFQPRFGLAYQFAPKMVVRGGYGIYYGQSRSGASGVVPYGGQGFNQYTSVISTYNNDGATPYLHLSDPFPNGLVQPAGSSLGLLNDVGYGANGPLRIAAANLTPYEQSWSLGVERQMPWNVVFDVEYLGKKGTHLPFSGTNALDILGPWVESIPVNGPNDQVNPCQILTVTCLNTLVTNPFSSQNGGPISDPNSSLSSPQVQYVQLKVPYPQFTGVTTDVQMIANSIYHGLQLSAEKHFSNGLEFLVNYTWSKSIDDASVGDDNVTWLGSFTSIQDPNKPWLERSLSTFDIPSVLKFSYSYDLPFGRGRAFLGNIPRALDAVIGGWRTNGIWQIADGRPLPLTVSNGGTPLPTYGDYGTQRPNLVGTPRRNYGPDWQDSFFANPDVFQVPAPFTLGDMQRTIASVRSPLTFTSDLSLIKQFLLSRAHEGINLELRLEAQNAFNHPLFSMGTPGPYGDSTLNVGDPNFGVISSMAPIGPRQVQLAAKVSF
ncbi:MAG TPA: TonB-dependent receptor [Candidatus Aquilonibacter sp.]|nr:TonB-dependent receptor [Candidatus Aquilonibacter sp.]